MESGIDEDTEKSALIAEALALYFDWDDPAEITTFIVVCERRDPKGNLTINSAWSAIPHWHLTGFVDELKTHIEGQRGQAALQQMMKDAEGGGENHD